MIKIFFFAWLQVALVAMNTWQIANREWLGALIVGFLISLVWTCNVRSALGTWPERLIYATGAGVGTGTGIAISILIYGY